MPCLDSRIHLLEIQQPISRSDLVHLAVDTRADDLRLTGKSKVLEIVNAFFRLGVMHNHGSTFDSIENLGRMETEGGKISSVQNTLAVYLNTKGMCRIINNLQAILVGNLLNPLCIARFPIDMHRHDGTGLRSNGCLYPVRINVSRGRIDIDENRLAIVPPNGMRCRHETVGCRNHLSSNPKRLQSC